jgi:hypothetical protein
MVFNYYHLKDEAHNLQGIDTFSIFHIYSKI